jgi:hypothetical protein
MEDESVEHFSYFMLRLHRHGAPATRPVVRGIVQQLSTGEKRTFTGAGELLDLLQHWPGPPDPKLEADRAASNTLALAELDLQPDVSRSVLRDFFRRIAVITWKKENDR